MLAFSFALFSCILAIVYSQEVLPLNGTFATQCSGTNDFCITAVDDGGSSVMFTLEGPLKSKKIGYLAMGFGTRMQNADVYYCWDASSSTGPQCRDASTGSSNVAPTVDSVQAIRVVTSSGVYNQTRERWSVSFIRDKTPPSGSSNAPVDLSKPIPMIWAYHKSKSPGASGTLVQHTNQGTLEFSMTNSFVNGGTASASSGTTHSMLQPTSVTLLLSIIAFVFFQSLLT